MVDEITPTYYAAGMQDTYTLTGLGFLMIPNDALGIRADNNETPMAYKNAMVDWPAYDIVEKSNTRIVLTARYDGAFGARGYLGCIVSKERDIVYWVNNSQPLPTNRGGIVDTEIIDKR